MAYSAMEKRKPAHDLTAFKVAFANAGRLRITGTAVRSAAALGFGRAEIVETLQTMNRSHVYKSITAHSNQRVWQDVYDVPSSVGPL